MKALQQTLARISPAEYARLMPSARADMAWHLRPWLLIIGAGAGLWLGTQHQMGWLQLMALVLWGMLPIWLSPRDEEAMWRSSFREAALNWLHIRLRRCHMTTYEIEHVYELQVVEGANRLSACIFIDRAGQSFLSGYLGGEHVWHTDLVIKRVPGTQLLISARVGGRALSPVQLSLSAQTYATLAIPRGNGGEQAVAEALWKQLSASGKIL